MGYSIFSLGLKVNNVKSVFGCKNHVTLLEISETDTFKKYFENSNNSDSLHGHKAISKALLDIISGDKFDEKLGSNYGYAMICICDYIGQKLPFTEYIKLGNKTDFISQILEDDFQLQGFDIEKVLLEHNTNAFEIPYLGDFPIMGLLLNSELIELQKKMQYITISDEDIAKLNEGDAWKTIEKKFAFESIRGIIQNINYCVEYNLDMVNFCH
jgi:hypothetical protein